VGPGTARLDYLAEIIAAARAWSLPEDAIAALEAIQRSAAARGAASLSPIRPAATRL